nr:LLM class flavin-dependent oxidoreductase [Hymenobacter sp. BRD67]
MHGDDPAAIGRRIQDLSERREKLGLPRMQFGVAAYSIVRNTEQEVKKELDRITNVQGSAAGYKNYQQWLAGTQLENQVSLQDYSVSNRGLRSGLTGTPAQVADRIAAFEAVGVDLFLLQCSPQLEEMERFSEAVIQVLA